MGRGQGGRKSLSRGGGAPDRQKGLGSAFRARPRTRKGRKGRFFFPERKTQREGEERSFAPSRAGGGARKKGFGRQERGGQREGFKTQRMKRGGEEVLTQLKAPGCDAQEGDKEFSQWRRPIKTFGPQWRARREKRFRRLRPKTRRQGQGERGVGLKPEGDCGRGFPSVGRQRGRGARRQKTGGNFPPKVRRKEGFRE